MTAVGVQVLLARPMAQRLGEAVERKGIGHPDTICDAIAEQGSRALCAYYLEHFGRVHHHNLDKALLVAGRTTPALGGGRVDEPMRLVVGDRAVRQVGAEKVPVGEIVAKAARRWMRGNLPHVDPDEHLIIQDEIKPGSAELVNLFAAGAPGANDTSVAAAYAPMSPTEQLVLATERMINSARFKRDFPETGEDVKVMAYRRGACIDLTLAVAFVDRFVESPRSYFRRRDDLANAVTDAASAGDLHEGPPFEVSVQVNALDRPGRGLAGMYLTVLGTSAECGDSGQVGRGNRINGVIGIDRPSSAEAYAGKNPQSHVGKLYAVVAQRAADRIHAELAGVAEAYVQLGSRIGQPVDDPALASIQLALAPGVSDMDASAAAILDDEIAGIPQVAGQLARGEMRAFDA